MSIQAQYGCAGNGEGSVVVELILVSTPNQGQDNTLQSFYEYTFYFDVRDNLGNNASSGCWTWEAPDNQANSVTPGNSGTSTFSFNQIYTGCMQYGQNSDLPTSIQIGMRGWEDDCQFGDVCDYDSGGLFSACIGNEDDDYEECNFNTNYDLTTLFAAGTCNDGTASQVVNYTCGQYTAQYRITVTLPVYPVAISGAPTAVYCANDGNINLMAATPGGTWSGMGVNAVSGVFDPESVPTGNYDITYTGINGCVEQSDAVTISIINPDASFTFPSSMCTDDLPFNLSPAETPGTWTVTRDDGSMGGINANNQFVPSLNGPGVYTISYMVGNSGVGCMETLTSSTFTVSQTPEFSVDVPLEDIACSQVVMQAVDITAGSGVYTYNWSGPGISGPTDGNIVVIDGAMLMDGTFNYTLDVNDSNGCAADPVAFSLTFDCSLPIELLDFEAEAIEAGIDLYWVTATEENNEGFYIERSLNGENFEPIEFIEGAGNSTNRTEYSLLDEAVMAGTLYYYRLRQVDFDGAMQYSEVVAAKSLGTPTDVITLGEVYPNPVKTRFRIDLETNKNVKVRAKIFNGSGKLMMRDRQKIDAGASQLEYNLSELPAGMYYIQFDIHQQQFSRKIMKVSP